LNCVTDERDGLTHTVRQSELLIQEKQVTENQLHGQVAVLKAEISTLLQTKDDVCVIVSIYFKLHLFYKLYVVLFISIIEVKI